jgi:hypothetical protein
VLAPYVKFAEMIEGHRDGITAHCQPENKVSLGFVEGLNNNIRVIQRRAYGLRDEEYLRLKILTCMLPILYNDPKSPTRLREESIICSVPHGTRQLGCVVDTLNNLGAAVQTNGASS